jgi:hypothetical protein
MNSLHDYPINASYTKSIPIEYYSFPQKDFFQPGYIEIPAQVTYPLAAKVIYVISSVLTFGLFPYIIHKISLYIAKKVLPALVTPQEDILEYRERKKSFIQPQQELVQEFDIQLEDGALINGMTLFLNETAKEAFKRQNAEDQKWIVRFKGSRGFFEGNLLGYQCLGQNLKANVLLFNYRGVGDSKGELWKPEQLILDGEACIQYLLSKGVKEENILIHGTSLGGAVGTQVASLHNQIALINERSFSTITAEVLAVIKKSPELALLDKRLDSPSAQFFLNYGLESLVSKIFHVSGWELDSIAAYKKIKAKKLIVYHKLDAIIPYYDSSFYKMIKENIKENTEATEEMIGKNALKKIIKKEYRPEKVKLLREYSGISVDAHIYSLDRDKAYPEIRKFIINFFSKV